MGAKYCPTCAKAVSQRQALLFEGLFYCVKCRTLLDDLGSEDAEITAPSEAVTMADVVDGVTGKGYASDAVNVDTVILACEDTLKQRPDDLSAWMTLAKRYYAAGNVEKAKQCVLTALAVDDTYADAQLFWAEKFSDSTDAAGVMTMKTVDPESLMELAYVYLDKQDMLNAKQVLTSITLSHKQHLGARRLLADLCLEQEDYMAAIQHLNVLKVNNPSDYMLEYNLGVAFYYMGQMDRALSCFRAAYQACKNPEELDDITRMIDQINTHTGE